MTTAATESLLQTYNAYNSRRGLREDPELTHVGRGTPLGEYLRRYWQPVAYEEDVTDLPLRLRILGEDLVLFRSGNGAYGLVEQRCSHRGASLEYGVISEQGIRCAYHGFHYAPDGTILETGSGAPMANAGKLCHGAYPLFVFAGLIFAYMGPPGKQPPFPMLDVYEIRTSRRTGPGAVHNALQLAANSREQHGPGAYRVSARADHRHAARLLRRDGRLAGSAVDARAKTACTTSRAAGSAISYGSASSTASCRISRSFRRRRRRAGEKRISRSAPTRCAFIVPIDNTNSNASTCGSTTIATRCARSRRMNYGQASAGRT